MKRSSAIILILLIIAGALTGCGPDQDKIHVDFLDILEQPASEETIDQISDYLDQNLPKVNEDYATDMVIRFEHYILEFDQDGINYSDWAERFKKYVFDALNELYQIKEKEQISPMVKDTNLVISWDELLERTYEMELYIHKNKDVELVKDDASWLYTNYMITLVMGTNGTPIFDYKTHEFNEAAKNSFSAFVNRHSDSATTWALTEYFTYLDSIGFTMDYNDKISSKLFFDTCDWLVSESGKRVFQ